MINNYLDELMNVTVHQLVRRNSRQTLQLVRGNDVVGFP